jgi:hypothetical protein
MVGSANSRKQGSTDTGATSPLTSRTMLRKPLNPRRSRVPWPMINSPKWLIRIQFQNGGQYILWLDRVEFDRKRSSTMTIVLAQYVYSLCD